MFVYYQVDLKHFFQVGEMAGDFSPPVWGHFLEFLEFT